jgi:hypothetical protein
MPEQYFVGLDLGQSQDYTALSILERKDRKPFTYDARHLQRFPLGTSYPDIVAKVSDMMRRAPLVDNADLVVDATGVGRPVIDLFNNARLRPVAVTIMGGSTVTEEKSRVFRVPKRDLVINLQVLFQQGRFRIADALPDSQTLLNELINFKVKITTSAHDTYEAWREGIHDDLVLSVALAAWYGQRGLGPALKLVALSGM